MLNQLNAQHHCESLQQELPTMPDLDFGRAKAGGRPSFKILVADGHPIFRYAMRSVFAAVPASCEIVEASCFGAVTDIVSKDDALGLVMLDLDMPGMCGLGGLTGLHVKAPGLPVILMSAKENRQVALQAIKHGATGFIAKSSSQTQVIKAVHRVLTGQVCPFVSLGARDRQVTPDFPSNGTRVGIEPERLRSLTRRQLLVLDRMAAGESNRQIAYRLHLAETTIKGHVSAILRKLRVTNRVQAILATKYLADV